MSQAKVDQYKKEKANRKKIMRREKAMRILGRVCACAILIAIVGWIGYSGYNYYQENKPTETYYADLTAISDYISDLSADAE